MLRPTTRVAVVLLHPTDRPALVEGALAAIPPDQLRFVEDDADRAGLALVDAPDIDSIEHANRALADHLVEAADLAIFVTTATRYADRVPWEVLGAGPRAGLPLLVVVNRMPPDAADRAEVLADVWRLIADARPGRPVAADAGWTRRASSVARAGRRAATRRRPAAPRPDRAAR